jgi:hypothetical protein
MRCGLYVQSSFWDKSNKHQTILSRDNIHGENHTQGTELRLLRVDLQRKSQPMAFALVTNLNLNEAIRISWW